MDCSHLLDRGPRAWIPPVRYGKMTFVWNKEVDGIAKYIVVCNVQRTRKKQTEGIVKAVQDS